MDEDLRIPPRLFGRVWHYRDRGQTMRSAHRHREVEANVVIRGTASYRIFDRRVDLQRHSLLWLFPKQDHVLFNTSPDFEMWIWVIKPEILRRTCGRDLVSVLCQDNPPEPYCRLVNPRDALAVGAVLRDAELSREDAPDVFNSGLLHATTLAWKAHTSDSMRAEPGAALHPAVEEAARLLADQDTDLETLASRLGQSPTYLSKLFRTQMGVKMIDYRNRMRIRRFLDSYGQGDRLTMVRAAFDAGFGSYPQFNRVFRQVMGQSPSSHRAATRVRAA